MSHCRQNIKLRPGSKLGRKAQLFDVRSCHEEARSMGQHVRVESDARELTRAYGITIQEAFFFLEAAGGDIRAVHALQKGIGMPAEMPAESPAAKTDDWEIVAGDNDEDEAWFEVGEVNVATGTVEPARAVPMSYASALKLSKNSAAAAASTVKKQLLAPAFVSASHTHRAPEGIVNDEAFDELDAEELFRERNMDGHSNNSKKGCRQAAKARKGAGGSKGKNRQRR